MQWLKKIADEIEVRRPDGDILIESGGSPSGTYHLGHLRELITADAVLLELSKRGRNVKHIYYVDDLDGLRKIPANIPAEYEKYLGKPLCDIPAPIEGQGSYANYILSGLVDATKALGMDIEFIRSHQNYRAGFFVPAIEKALEHSAVVREILENVSGHKLSDEWSPVQVNEGGYLKKRRFESIDKAAKTITYLDHEGQQQVISYKSGEVKLDWRIDWPARWWLLEVDAEPFGRDHATKGGSYDTGAAFLEKIFQAPPVLPIPYDFVNMAGDNKKMSASKGTGLDAAGVVKVLPPEIIRFFMLRYPPSKRLYFDPENGVAQLIDEYAELLNKDDKSDEDNNLIELCTHNISSTISSVPFSHLVACYQSALRDPAKTLEIIVRTDQSGDVKGQEQKTVQAELKFIEEWLNKWAPDDIKFELTKSVDGSKLSNNQREFLSNLANKIESAPKEADGEWFHKAIYDLKGTSQLEPKELFVTLYQVLIGKDAGPRAGWFLSILPRPWLVERLRLEK